MTIRKLARLVNPTVYIYNLDVPKHALRPHLPFSLLLDRSQHEQFCTNDARYLLSLKSL